MSSANIMHKRTKRIMFGGGWYADRLCYKKKDHDCFYYMCGNVCACIGASCLRAAHMGRIPFCKALDQWTRDLPLTAQRGDILDTQGKIIATSETVYDVYVRPKSVEDPEEVARVLSDVLQLSYDDVYKKATEKTFRM